MVLEAGSLWPLGLFPTMQGKNADAVLFGPFAFGPAGIAWDAWWAGSGGSLTIRKPHMFHLHLSFIEHVRLGGGNDSVDVLSRHVEFGGNGPRRLALLPHGEHGVTALFRCG